jgi:hypothetical protein
MIRIGIIDRKASIPKAAGIVWEGEWGRVGLARPGFLARGLENTWKMKAYEIK